MPLASLVGGFAESEATLIAARAVQGLGAALLSPAALSIVTTTFSDGSERNKALGVWGAVAGSGGAAGVLLGGILTEYVGWEWVLWVNVPIGIAAALLAPRLILESRAEHETRHFDVRRRGQRHRRSLAPRLRAGRGAGRRLGLGPDDRARWRSPPACSPRSSRIELRSKAPLMPFRIFRNRTLTGANVVGILTGASLFSMFFFISLYMQNVLGFSAIKAGLSYLPLAVSIIIAAGIASQLVTKVGFKPVLALGMLFVSAGLLWFSQISVDGSFLGDVLGPSLLAAVGLGFAFVPQTIAAMSGVADREAGLASGLINTSQQVGGALGLAVLSSVAFSTIGDLAATGNTGPAALTEGYADAFMVGAGIGLLGVIATLFLIRGRDSRAHTEIGAAEPVEA